MMWCRVWFCLHSWRNVFFMCLHLPLVFNLASIVSLRSLYVQWVFLPIVFLIVCQWGKRCIFWSSMLVIVSLSKWDPKPNPEQFLSQKSNCHSTQFTVAVEFIMLFPMSSWLRQVADGFWYLRNGLPLVFFCAHVSQGNHSFECQSDHPLRHHEKICHSLVELVLQNGQKLWLLFYVEVLAFIQNKFNIYISAHKAYWICDLPLG